MWYIRVLFFVSPESGRTRTGDGKFRYDRTRRNRRRLDLHQPTSLEPSTDLVRDVSTWPTSTHVTPPRLPEGSKRRTSSSTSGRQRPTVRVDSSPGVECKVPQGPLPYPVSSKGVGESTGVGRLSSYLLLWFEESPLNFSPPFLFLSTSVCPTHNRATGGRRTVNPI